MSGCQRRFLALMVKPMLGRLVIGGTRLRRAPHCLAMLAILIQFVLSFGHIHAQTFAALQQGHGALGIVNLHGAGGDAGQGLGGDIGCPICSSIQMLGSSALPDGIHLRLPPAQHAAIVISETPLRLRAPPHLLFATRAPPSV